MRMMEIDKNFFTTGHPFTGINDIMKRLQEEHVVLKVALLELYGMAKAIGFDEDVINWVGSLRDLRTKVTAFMEELDVHAKWEEAEVFPMMGWYFDTPIDHFTEMEQQHELAEQYIAAFLARVERLFEPIRREEAREITSLLLCAYHELNEHFEKEEEIIVAMTDRSNTCSY